MDRDLVSTNLKTFEEAFGGGGTIRHFFSPGRVNIIGEHLDYNGGCVFPAALDLGIHALARFNGSGKVTMMSAGFPGSHTVETAGTIENDGTGKWWNYPSGVIKYLIAKGTGVTGAEILYFGTLPEGAGLSSSAAIEVLTAYAFSGGTVKSDRDRIDIALLCKSVENEFIGVQCGIMDQFAVAMGKKDHAILLNADTLAYNRVPFILDRHRLVIMNSNKKRKLSDSKYNERRAQCEQALAALKKTRSIANLTEASIGEIEGMADPVLKKRARHVLTENNRVLASVELLKAGDIVKFGNLLTESHRSLRDDYEVTGFELDSLADASLRSPGCIGARMTGAGFGGCCIALVESGGAEDFIGQTGDRYRRATGLTAGFYETGIADGVREVTE